MRESNNTYTVLEILQSQVLNYSYPYFMLFWCLAVCARGHEDILLEECLWGELSVEDHWDHSQLFLSVCKYILYLCVEEQDRERTNESVTLRAWSLAVLMLPMFRFFAAIQSKHAFTKLGWMDFGNVIWCLFLTETLFLSFFFLHVLHPLLWLVEIR